MFRPKLPIFSIFFLAVFFSTTELWISVTNAQTGTYSFKYLQESFPELESNIVAVAEDPRGFIWFGGEKNIQRYDGYSIKTYPIRSILESSGEKISPGTDPGFLTDSFGNFWVYSNTGLFIYQQAMDRFTRVLFNAPIDFFYPMPNIKPDLFTIKAMMEDDKKNLWIGMDGSVLFHFPIAAVQQLFEKKGTLPDKIELPDTLVTPIWFQSEKYTKNASESIKSRYYNFENFRPEVLKLMQDKDGDIWINSNTAIFRLIERDGKHVLGGRYFVNHLNRFYWTKNVFLDNDKNLWIGVANYLALKCNRPPQAKDMESVPPEFQNQTLPYGTDSAEANTDFHFKWFRFDHDMGFQGHSGYIDNLYFGCNNQIFIKNENKVMSYSLSWDARNHPVFKKGIYLERNKNDPGTFWQDSPSGLHLTNEFVLLSGDPGYGATSLDLSIQNTFRKLYPIEGNPNSLPAMLYSYVYDLGDGYILIGGRENQLYVTDHNFTSFRKLPLGFGLAANVDTFIEQIIEDNSSRLWITNYIGQMVVFNKNCVFETTMSSPCSYQLNAANFFGMNEMLHINSIAFDTNGILWAATGNGLYWLDLTSSDYGKHGGDIIFKKFESFDQSKDSLIFRNVEIIIPVKPDFFLFASANRYYCFNPQDQTYHQVIIEGGLPSDEVPVLWFYELADNGTLWSSDMIYNSSITFIQDIQTGYYKCRIKKYTTTDGFPENAYEFVSDHQNNLWIYPESSRYGIVKFSPADNTYTYFNGPGIIKNAVFGGLHGKDSAGRIYLGAMDGITVFHPDSIKLNEYLPPVRITDIRINHKSIYPELDTSRLLKLDRTGILKLKPKENHLSIEFAALSYANPESNQYAYFLDGFDEDTIITTADNRIASYSNLSPGKYEFFVKGTNNNLKWSNQAARLLIIVLTPWYASWWAFFLYSVIGISLIVLWRIYDLRRIRLEHEAELEHTEAEKLRELDRVKSEFFSNISHEFRTPLTLILGPLDEIINKTGNSLLKNQALMMKRNALLLLKLINQILDLSMLDAGKLKLQASYSDICTFLKDVVANFESAAENKHIQLTCRIPEHSLLVYFDSDKLEDVLDNLLENALKFTPRGGVVLVELKQIFNNDWGNGELSDGAEIIVCDTGTGIPADKLPRVFDRFFQVDSSQTRRHEGAGIGLSLAHELVRLHHGSIEVRSEQGKGTTFTLKLRLGNRHFNHDELIDEVDKEIVPRKTQDSQGILEEAHEIVMENSGTERKGKISLPEILVVENNADMCHYIMNSLDHEFVFHGAEDGIIGFEQAIKLIPDLIISDLMMPGMDGYELCNKLKNDERTRHIPVILLTAKAAKKNQLQGYESGADDYVTKPFDKQIMLGRIKNLLRERRLLREKFSLEWAKNPSGQEVVTADEKFIIRLNSILERNYSNPEFGTTYLGKEAGYSHSVLYRKLKAVTNLSPSTYIRNFRLIKAQNMIKTLHMDVSTTAYNCGFNNLSYFSKCYKQFFHGVPHEMQNNKT